MLGKLFSSKERAVFDQGTPEDEIAAFVDQIRSVPSRRNELVPLLREGHPLYQGRGTQECIRLRGYILAAFETTGLPPGALIFALEDLYNTRSAYLIAGAAKAIRGMKTPHPEAVPYLLEAVVNIRLMDDSVCFDSYKPVWPVENSTSGLREVFKTFQWMGAYAGEALPKLEHYASKKAGFSREVRAAAEAAVTAIKNDPREVDLSCCGPSPKLAGRKSTRKWSAGRAPDLGDILLEDQHGDQVSFASFFQGKPTIVSFFYTRCTSINKCSLTVGNTGALANEIKQMGLAEKVNIALITYDPVYDLPARIRVYGENRRCEFSDSFKAFRVSPGDYDRIKAYFGLEVGYSASIVNQHRVETYLLDRRGSIRHTLSRIQWSIDEIASKVTKLVAEPQRKRVPRITKAVLRNFSALLFPILIAIFPKCPMCWASYMSAFGIAGLNEIPYSPWLVPLFAVGIGINLLVLYRLSKRRNGLFPFWASALGVAVLLIFGFWLEYNLGLYTGLILILTGSILNSLPFSKYHRLMNSLSNNWGRALPSQDQSY